MNTPSKRKVIQISAIPETENLHEALFALCDDGNIFRITNKNGVTPGEWEMITPVPSGDDGVKQTMTETVNSCLFCEQVFVGCGVTCLGCGRSPKEAARELLKRIKRIAEDDIFAGNPITGAHHRAIEKVLKEIA